MSSFALTRNFKLNQLISQPTALTLRRRMHLFILTLLLVTHCAEVALRPAYGYMLTQATDPDVHEFQICPRSKY